MKTTKNGSENNTVPTSFGIMNYFKNRSTETGSDQERKFFKRTMSTLNLSTHYQHYAL